MRRIFLPTPASSGRPKLPRHKELSSCGPVGSSPWTSVVCHGTRKSARPCLTLADSSPLATSGVAQSYFSPRKITLRYAFQCVCAGRRATTRGRPTGRWESRAHQRGFRFSDNTKRRSRDIAPSIFLKPVTATRHFSMSSIPHGVPQSNRSRRTISRYAALRYAASLKVKMRGDRKPE